jgi:hypothetical protein
VLIADHAAGSPWLWYAAEDLQLEAAWQAAERRTIRKQQSVEAVQQFPDYAALEAKMVAQGPSSLERIGSFRGTHPITIPMPYRLALL